jgi:hypothetical protein
MTGFTKSVAGALVTLPAELLTRTVNVAPPSVHTVGGVVYVEEVAPPMLVPFRIHWYVNGAVPFTVTEKIPAWPTVTVTLPVCVAMVGATTVEPGGGDEEPPPPLLQPAKEPALHARAARRIDFLENSNFTKFKARSWEGVGETR